MGQEVCLFSLCMGIKGHVYCIGFGVNLLWTLVCMVYCCGRSYYCQQMKQDVTNHPKTILTIYDKL